MNKKSNLGLQLMLEYISATNYTQSSTLHTMKYSLNLESNTNIKKQHNT